MFTTIKSLVSGLIVIVVTGSFIITSDGCLRGKGRVDVQLECPPSMERTAGRRSTSAMLTWSAEDFVVHSSHPIKGLYETVPHYGATGAVYRSFEEGVHFVEYKAVDEAGNFAQCSFYVTVKVNRCPPIYSPLNGVLTCNAATLFGSRCSVSCIPGFKADGQQTELECLANRQWSSEIPFCKKVTCPDPGTPLHGSRTCTTRSHVYGSVCSFSCATGFHLRGNERLVCGLTGDWLSASPYCIEIIAPKIQSCPTGRGSTLTSSGPAQLVYTTSGSWVNVPKPVVLFVAGDEDYFDDVTETTRRTPERWAGLSQPVSQLQRTRRVLEIPHTCTHFGDSSNHTFALGSHWVVCTAVDERFHGDQAVARCQFEIRVDANPCRQLSQPLHGDLLCSRTTLVEGAVGAVCQVFCHRGYVASRVTANGWPMRTTEVEFHCDNTGNWQPVDYVPSCVVPRRPHALELPTELLYTSCKCPDIGRLNYFRTHFQAIVQARRENPCVGGSGDCIVGEVAVTCHRNPGVSADAEQRCPRDEGHLDDHDNIKDSLVAEKDSVVADTASTRTTPDYTRRSATHRTPVRIGVKKRGNGASSPASRQRQRTSSSPSPFATNERPQRWQRDVIAYPLKQLVVSDDVQSDADRRLESRTVGDGVRKVRRSVVRSGGLPFVIPIQFNLITRVPETGGSWPDGYRLATDRLYAMFDAVERLFVAGDLDVALQTGASESGRHGDDEMVAPVADSLTSAHFRPICELGNHFDENILLCVPCGAGSHFDIASEQCVLCSPGAYQPEQAKFDCVPCPPGTASLEYGATNQTQCVDIDECVSNPCSNNGLCENRHSSYYCACPSSFSGVNCEERIYDCRSNACTNGATCRPIGATNYTCLCRPSYYGDYCQFYTVDGGWSEWTEWSACSKSCEGGVTVRNRSCDSPLPGNGGSQCIGAPVQEKVCNTERCPECKRLRRPYQGTIHCDAKTPRDQNDDVSVRCTIACQKGYTFNGAALTEYQCGRSTSYLWPHESPDNPRALLPACTERLDPVSATFEFRSAIADIEGTCSSPSARQQLLRAVEERSRQLTVGLPCLQAGTCTLDAPHVVGCHLPPPTFNETDSTAGSRSSSLSRTRRVVPEMVEVAVSLTYRHNSLADADDDDDDAETDLDDTSEDTTLLNDDYRRVTHDLQTFGTELLDKGALYIEVNGSKVEVDRTRMSTSNTVVCPEGSMSSSDETQCIRCGPGSFFSRDKLLCVLCDVGFFQPGSGQTECVPCRNQQITYGRGAINSIECYVNGSVPPALPETYDENELWNTVFYALVTCSLGVFVATLLCLTATVLLAHRRRLSTTYVINAHSNDLDRSDACRHANQSKERIHLCATGYE